MKTAQDTNNRKSPVVRINPELEELRGKVLFPAKLAKANEMLKKVKLPPNKNL